MQRKNITLFLIGALSLTQIRVIGSIGISELWIFFAAPFFYVRNASVLRKDGFLPMLNLAILACVSCILSSWYNHTDLPLALRGFASVYAIFAMPVIFHHYLRNNLCGLKWLLIGLAISGLLTLFGMRTGVEVAMEERLGDASLSDLFFGRHFGALFSLPAQAFYFEVPTLISAISFLIPTAYVVATAATGRSMVLINAASIFLVLAVNKSWRRMRLIQKQFVFICIVGVVLVLVLTSAYKFLAENGFLNEKAQRKYQLQTSGKSDPISLIMQGRAEFFIGLFACLDRPIFGAGPWPLDVDGYQEQYIQKYGTVESLQSFVERREYYASKGIVRYGLIPAHSYIIGHWLCYGIGALPFWLYILYLISQVMRKYISAIPQWYGYFALEIPAMLWHIFFSPFSGRVSSCIFITCLLLARAVGQNKVELPYEMLTEAIKHEK